MVLAAVVDFEESGAADFHFDVRYLPGNARTLDLLLAPPGCTNGGPGARSHWGGSWRGTLSPSAATPGGDGRLSGAECMVNGMATKKITVTLDEQQVERIRRLVGAGKVATVSGFVQHAVAVSLDDVAGWGAMLAEALAQTGGDLTDEERAWADRMLGTGTKAGSTAA
jgi:Arc/MetJ-type ribon-helix-helix transcriptional regulator